MTLLTAMSLVLVGFAVWGGAIVGIGLIVARLLGRRGDDAPPWLAFWIGFSGLCAALQLWHFAAPIDGVASSIAIGVGWIGFAWHRADVARWWRARRRGPTIAAAIFAVWIANRALAPGETADGGMYHYVAVDWARSYPLVIGLGNLSGWQAMNNACFLYDALLDVGPFRGRVEHLANGLLVAAWAMHWCAAAGAMWRRSARASDAFALAALPMLIFVALGSEMPSPDNDLPGALLALALGAATLALVERHASAWQARAIVLLGAATVCCKLSMLALAGGWTIVALIYAGRSARVAPLLVAAAAIACIAIGPWLARSVLLTGYPLYPSTFAAVDASWRVPEARAAAHRDGVTRSARYYIPDWLANVAQRNGLGVYATLMRPPADQDVGLAATKWIRAWLFTIPLWGPTEIVVPIAFAGGVAWIARRRSERRVLLIVPFAAIAFWFVVAPDPRFGWAACWTLAGVALATAPTVRGRGPVIAIVAVCAVPVAFKIATEAVMWHHAVLPRIPFVMPGADGGFHPRPTAELAPWTSDFGVVVYRPTTNTPAVWSGPLPRLGWPAPDPRLAYRVPARGVAGGFVLRDAPPATRP